MARRLIHAIFILSFLALLLFVVLASPFSPTVSGNVWSALQFAVGLFGTYLAVYIVNTILRRYIHGFIAKQPQLETTYTFLRRLVLLAVALIGVGATVFTTFPAAGGLIASLFVAAGFTSIVVGLAAQSSLSNLISGMIVSVSQPFRIGDAVMFKNEFCYVEDIKLMHTVLRTWDNRRLLVPNSLFQSEVIVNYSVEDPTMLAPIFVQVSYESDLDKAMQIMKDIALRHPDCLPTGDLPNVVLMDFGDSGITLRLLSRAKDQPTAFKMSRDIMYQIKKEFDANGIEIPYPRRYLVLGKETEKILGGLTSSSNKQ